MIEKMVVCDIARVWGGVYRFKVYIEDDNVLIMGSTIDIYI